MCYTFCRISSSKFFAKMGLFIIIFLHARKDNFILYISYVPPPPCLFLHSPVSNEVIISYYFPNSFFPFSIFFIHFVHPNDTRAFISLSCWWGWYTYISNLFFLTSLFKREKVKRKHVAPFPSFFFVFFRIDWDRANWSK